jgi:hypothetical protein
LKKIPKKGDLVRIVNHEFKFDDTIIVETCGIVVEGYDILPPNQTQIRIFPEVQVYLLKTRKIVPLPVGGVEIISHCKREP